MIQAHEMASNSCLRHFRRPKQNQISLCNYCIHKLWDCIKILYNIREIFPHWSHSQAPNAPEPWPSSLGRSSSLCLCTPYCLHHYPLATLDHASSSRPGVVICSWPGFVRYDSPGDLDWLGRSCRHYVADTSDGVLWSRGGCTRVAADLGVCRHYSSALALVSLGSLHEEWSEPSVAVAGRASGCQQRVGEE